MKTKLKIKISKLEDFRNPKASLEQYVTPPELVTDLVYSAYMQNDIEGCEVVDLGAGTGYFSIAASFLGADVLAVEKDEDAVRVLESNLELSGEDVVVKKQDISELNGDYDTVLMNPPYSVHSEMGEEFLRKAMEISNSIYAVVSSGLLEGLKEFSDSWKIEAVEPYKIDIPPTMGFHTEEDHEINVKAVHLRMENNGT